MRSTRAGQFSAPQLSLDVRRLVDMHTKRPKILALCGVSLFLIPGQYVLAQEDTLLADVEAEMRALYDGDVETAMRYAHPELIEINGGPAAFRRLVERT